MIDGFVVFLLLFIIFVYNVSGKVFSNFCCLWCYNFVVVFQGFYDFGDVIV